ncbi:hypothetical protein NONI108955_29680 [Nocardia ninae]
MVSQGGRLGAARPDARKPARSRQQNFCHRRAERLPYITETCTAIWNLVQWTDPRFSSVALLGGGSDDRMDRTRGMFGQMSSSGEIVRKKAGPALFFVCERGLEHELRIGVPAARGVGRAAIPGIGNTAGSLCPDSNGSAFSVLSARRPEWSSCSELLSPRRPGWSSCAENLFHHIWWRTRMSVVGFFADVEVQLSSVSTPTPVPGWNW